MRLAGRRGGKQGVRAWQVRALRCSLLDLQDRGAYIGCVCLFLRKVLAWIDVATRAVNIAALIAVVVPGGGPFAVRVIVPGKLACWVSAIFSCARGGLGGVLLATFDHRRRSALIRWISGPPRRQVGNQVLQFQSPRRLRSAMIAVARLLRSVRRPAVRAYAAAPFRVASAYSSPRCSRL